MQTNIYTCYLGCLNYSMIFEFEHPLLGLYLTSEQNFDYWTYFQLGFSFSFKEEETINKDSEYMKLYLDDPERVIKMIKVRQGINC